MKIREQVFILPTSMPANYLYLLCQDAFFVYARICAASHAGYRFSHPLDYGLQDSTPIFPFTATPNLLHLPVQSSAAGQILADQTSVFSRA